MIRRVLPVVLLAAVFAGTNSRAEYPPSVNYKLHCMGCHLADASGGPPDVPDLRGEMGCMLSVEGGREYLVQVPGASQAPITDAELAAVVNYMLENFSADTLPANFVPLSEDEVALWREDWLTDVTEVRQALMRRLEDHCLDGTRQTRVPSGSPPRASDS